MREWRELKTKLKNTVHKAMRVRAVVTPAIQGSEPTAVWVRVHYVYEEYGDVKGTNLGYGTIVDKEPKLVVSIDDIGLFPVKSVVAISDSEAYRVERHYPSDMQFVTLDCSRLPAGRFVAPDVELLASLT